MEEERKVATQDGEMLAHEWGCPFFETSAKTGCNTQEAFQEVVREIVWREKQINASLQETDITHAGDQSAIAQQMNQSTQNCCCVCS